MNDQETQCTKNRVDPASAHCIVRKLVGDMDAKFARWDIYRTALGEWHLKGEQSAQTCEITADGFVEAIEEALQWRALPLVPRPRERLCREHFKPKKSGSKWRIAYLGRDCCVQCDTKRAVEALADRQVALSISETDRWESEYGWSREKTEGVDFRWSS